MANSISFDYRKPNIRIATLSIYKPVKMIITESGNSGEVLTTQLFIDSREIMRHVQLAGEETVPFEVPPEYIDHLKEKRQELINALQARVTQDKDRPKQ